MKTIKANNYSQAVKEVEALDKDQVKRVKEEIKHSDRKHNHVVVVSISDRPGEAKNEVTVNTIIVNDDKLNKLKKNFKFLGYSKIIILHDASQVKEDETPVLHIHDKQSIEAKVKADLEAKHKAEMDELRKKYQQEALDNKSNNTDGDGSGDGTDGGDNGGDGGSGDDINLMEVYAEQVDATVDDLKKFASDNLIDLSGLKKKEDIQLAIAAWLHEQSQSK